MPNVLILCAHRPGRSPSQRYRFEQYLPYLSANGFEFTWSYLLDAERDRVFYSRGHFLKKVMILAGSLFKRFGDCYRFSKYDIVFIQREATFFGTSYFEKRAYRSGAKVILDFDDSIWLADTSPGNQKWEFVKKPGKFFKSLTYAYQVIAGNEYLAQKARTVHNRVTIIPTTIDTDIHVPKPQLRGGDQVVIGWSGSVSTVKHFELLVPTLLKIWKEFGDNVSFKLVGDKHYKHNTLPVTAVEWTENTEVDTLNSFDIGVMPLPDDEWSQGKCALKALSYMACAVPAVMSAVGVNKSIVTVDPRNGYLANNDEEWHQVLRMLIGDKLLREGVGNEGRRTVVGKFSVEANKRRYLELLTHVLTDA